MSVLDQSFHKTIASAGCFDGCCRETTWHPDHSSAFAPVRDGSRVQHLTGEDQQKKQELDAMLSEAFTNLSFEDRQAQQELLHGVADTVPENPSLVEESLKELESVLCKTKSGRAYETAEQEDPEYVNSRSLRVSFLRSDQYNVKAAADRMLRFFDEKQKLFPDKLTKDITVDDLDDDDIVALKSGSAQWVGTDRSGRHIILHLPGLLKNFKLKSELRAHYMILIEGAKSPETQLRGVITLVYAVGEFKDHETEGSRYINHTRLASSMPLNLGAFHKACDDMRQYLVGRAAISILPAPVRTRVRLHYGTHLECQYLLASYGIPAEEFPLLPETYAVDMGPHLRWCEKYIIARHNDGTIDQSIATTSAGAITEPKPNDVLSAGFTRSDNMGNDRLRVLVRDNLEAYRAGSSYQKRIIVDRIIGEIHSAGGRFLKKEKGSQTWNELPRSKTRQILTQRFRNHNRQRDSVAQQAWTGTLIPDLPHPNDVILGRTILRSRGTELFHLILKDRLEEYEAANRKAKVIVVDAIIERIQREGGRFLQPSEAKPGRFVELSSTDSIRGRISTYFRNHRKRSVS